MYTIACLQVQHVVRVDVYIYIYIYIYICVCVHFHRCSLPEHVLTPHKYKNSPCLTLLPNNFILLPIWQILVAKFSTKFARTCNFRLFLRQFSNSYGINVPFCLVSLYVAICMKVSVFVYGSKYVCSVYLCIGVRVHVMSLRLRTYLIQVPNTGTFKEGSSRKFCSLLLAPSSVCLFRAQVTWTAAWDIDNEQLCKGTYKLCTYLC
jgi:hypothetical protein